MSLTYDQLLEENALLKAMIKKLEEKISHLEAQINKNSKNSSKSPSSDKKPNLPLSQKKEYRPYHPGASRQLLPESEVTSRDVRKVAYCPRCRSVMQATEEVLKWQQIELPPIKPLVHQIELVTCLCPRCHLKISPELTEGEQFLLGPRLEGFINLLMGQYRQGHRPIREIIAMILPGLTLSQGLISKIKARAAIALSIPYEELLTTIVSSNNPLHADATGWRHCGQNEYAIVLRVGNLIAYALTPRQNSATLRTLLGRCIQRLVTDRGLACGQIEVATHQYCIAHLIRNILGQVEDSGITCSDTERLGELYDTLQELFIDKHRAQRGEISALTWRHYGYRKWRQIQEMVEELTIVGSTKKLRRFCKRLLRELHYFRAYLKDPSLPMTNNAAEEALRNLVIARKLCFGSRSIYGKRWREALQSCIETLRRNGKSILDFLAEAIYAARTGQQSPSVL